VAGLEVKSSTAPDETRPFAARGKADVVALSTGPVLKAVFEPGWRWSEHVKPIAGTASCQIKHLGYVLSGRMKVVMDDGSEGEVGAGDVFAIAPGHDAWTVGEEPVVVVDWYGASNYAKQT
jgi:quercetin dioxygenase-like cupin family protein